MFCQVGRVGSLGHYGFKASFTDGLCVVHGLALTDGNVSEIFPYLLRVSAFSTSLGRLAGVLMPLSAMSVSLCSVSVCHHETMPTLAAGSEEAKRICTHINAAPLSHKVHKVLIKHEKYCF